MKKFKEMCYNTVRPYDVMIFILLIFLSFIVVGLDNKVKNLEKQLNTFETRNDFASKMRMDFLETYTQNRINDLNNKYVNLRDIAYSAYDLASGEVKTKDDWVIGLTTFQIDSAFFSRNFRN